MSWWSVHGIWVRGSPQAPSRHAVRLTQTFLGTARWATGASYHSLARTVNTLWMREGMGNFRTPSKKNYEIHHHEKGEWGKVWKCLSVQSGNNPKTTLHFVPWNLLYFSNPSSTVSGNEKKKRISMYFLKFYPLLRPTEVDLSIPCTSNFVNIARR